jgi:hypothetical protein
VLISSPQILTRIPGIGSRMPPTYNIIISNVPGPRSKLYFMGAEMEAYYPISALAHGQALNITVLSYAGGLYFGYTGCADKVPHLQRLAVYTGEAIDELERVFMAAPPATAAKGRRGGKKKSKAKAKATRKRAAAKPAQKRAAKAAAGKAKEKG